jgi:hypothetical protein
MTSFRLAVVRLLARGNCLKAKHQIPIMFKATALSCKTSGGKNGIEGLQF